MLVDKASRLVVQTMSIAYETTYYHCVLPLVFYFSRPKTLLKTVINTHLYADTSISHSFSPWALQFQTRLLACGGWSHTPDWELKPAIYVKSRAASRQEAKGNVGLPENRNEKKLQKKTSWKCHHPGSNALAEGSRKGREDWGRATPLPGHRSSPGGVVMWCGRGNTYTPYQCYP